MRMARTKSPTTRPKFELFVRYTFAQNSQNVSERNVSAVEHLLRKGKRQLEVYENPAVRDCWVSQEMRDWDTAWRKRH